MTKKKETKKPVLRTTPHAATTAASILGRPAANVREDYQPKKIKGEWRQYYARLLELREQLMRQVDGLAKESPPDAPSGSPCQSIRKRRKCSVRCA